LLFLVDAQLPPLLAEALRQAGCEAVHVIDLGLQAASDEQIWDEAISRSAVLVTKDRDFAFRTGRNERWPSDPVGQSWQYEQSKADRARVARLAGNYRRDRTR
jgi:uncharacterized protein with PIN domain